MESGLLFGDLIKDMQMIFLQYFLTAFPGPFNSPG
jgi:hypothetical protein